MKNTKYPEVVKQMKLHKQSLQDVADLLGISDRSVIRRLSGEVEWSIGDVDTLCRYYNIDFWKLFRKEN